MSIRINEMTIEVDGNVVKNMSEDGGSSLLRLNEEQAHSIMMDLIVHFREKNAGSSLIFSGGDLASELSESVVMPGLQAVANSPE